MGGGWWAGGEQDLLVCRVRFVGVDRQGLSLLVVDLPEVLTMRSANLHNEKTKKENEERKRNESESEKRNVHVFAHSVRVVVHVSPGHHAIRAQPDDVERSGQTIDHASSSKKSKKKKKKDSCTAWS